MTERGKGRLAAHEPFGHQADESDEGGADGVEAPAGPADGPWQHYVVPADDVGGDLQGTEPLDLIDDDLDVTQ
jgi:hypothetical protein